MYLGVRKVVEAQKARYTRWCEKCQETRSSEQDRCPECGGVTLLLDSKWMSK